jgi:hypothetical protein
LPQTIGEDQRRIVVNTIASVYVLGQAQERSVRSEGRTIAPDVDGRVRLCPVGLLSGEVETVDAGRFASALCAGEPAGEGEGDEVIVGSALRRPPSAIDPT